MTNSVARTQTLFGTLVQLASAFRQTSSNSMRHLGRSSSTAGSSSTTVSHTAVLKEGSIRLFVCAMCTHVKNSVLSLKLRRSTVHTEDQTDHKVIFYGSPNRIQNQSCPSLSAKPKGLIGLTLLPVELRLNGVCLLEGSFGKI